MLFVFCSENNDPLRLSASTLVRRGTKCFALVYTDAFTADPLTVTIDSTFAMSFLFQITANLGWLGFNACPRFTNIRAIVIPAAHSAFQHFTTVGWHDIIGWGCGRIEGSVSDADLVNVVPFALFVSATL